MWHIEWLWHVGTEMRDHASGVFLFFHTTKSYVTQYRDICIPLGIVGINKLSLERLGGSDRARNIPGLMGQDQYNIYAPGQVKIGVNLPDFNVNYPVLGKVRLKS